jgi:hypothetical protein
MEDATGEKFLNSWTGPFTPLISGTSPYPSRFTCWEEIVFEPTSPILHRFLQKIGTFSQQFRFDPLSARELILRHENSKF